jgi:hypothetical protein
LREVAGYAICDHKANNKVRQFKGRILNEDL